MLTDVVIEDDRWEALALDQLAEQAATQTLTHLGLDSEDWEIAVLGCDDARIAELNGEFRDKQNATNVLSWPSEERGAETAGQMPDLPQPGFDPELGDIAIAFDTCEAEAKAADKPIHEHVTHLLVHATLHLLGYDHIRDPDATLMERTETVILGNMGIPDPY